MRHYKKQPLLDANARTLELATDFWQELHKQVFEEFCPRFAPGAMAILVSSDDNRPEYFDENRLRMLGSGLFDLSLCPDFVIHDTRRNWLVLIEVVTTGGPVDGKRRQDLKRLFSGSSAGLVFVTAFITRDAMRSFLPQISWESEVWVADAPDHLIHFNGERFLGPYPDVMMPRPTK